MVKNCSRCQQEKPLAEFHKRKNSFRPECKQCRSVWMKEYYQRTREAKATYSRKYRYNITEDVYQQLRTEQKDSCKICGEVSNSRELAVDHCHETGKIRGLLCSNCNTGIGLFLDDPSRLQAAIEYLNG